MTAQDYIEQKLQELRQPLGLQKPENADDLVEAIFKALMSKKFRKYAASEELQQHMKAAIRLNIDKNEPINLTFLHGAYKLWRLEEAPEADWAELFSLMYYSNWVKPVCELYEPGVWFDFFVDDYIINRLDNISMADIQAYINSYQSVVNFLKPYQPDNLKMTITPVGSRFASEAAFDESLQINFAKQGSELPVLTDTQWAMVELNTKPTDEQLQDPQWREKVYQLHNAYSATKAEPGYHKNRPEKILVFPQSLPNAIAVGTTKSSVMKFWIGAGVLRSNSESYSQTILSPNQLKDTNYRTEPIHISNLTGKNFTQIKTL